ncbi:transcriptional regulator GcvA [Massilia sp. YIM B04103]|uniref:transcriptional regulator GcvA n=1 Tax=Massilia sp. YIM B04103 TaxID=2963106 RepID=UPI00210D43C9|nr:transcriptional regulator GcvA [Massilia sp. YIM B04103]
MKLPPLHALLCFANAGRRLSMKQAAEELHVTPAAVSQQIAKLEEAVGTQLFVRSPRRLALTEAGKAYLRAVLPALRQIAEATELLRQQHGASVVTLSCTSGFAMQWLLPRLARFQAREPHIDVRINTTDRIVDLLVDGIDFAVRHGLGCYPGLESECLINDRLLPVCSPALLARPLDAPGELAGYTLLHDEHRLDWTMWLRAVQAPHVDPGRGPVFVDSNGAVDAALAGRGIALLRGSLVRQELASGRLVMPLRHTIETPLAYYLVYDDSVLLQSSNQRFRQWLMAEARADQGEFLPS